ncbi:hypothetical protein QBC41DRAFT_308752 [Cercophora samala]|uniref:Uncharacterized protein n=1 Tax=Cercophora samala TaxID=330535 RepID=A0AA40DH95_9PEZI|nr:hypothetical protein QBC41DRAFT_308752 [Cercophora samala]
MTGGHIHHGIFCCLFYLHMGHMSGRVVSVFVYSTRGRRCCVSFAYGYGLVPLAKLLLLGLSSLCHHPSDSQDGGKLLLSTCRDLHVVAGSYLSALGPLSAGCQW